MEQVQLTADVALLASVDGGSWHVLVIRRGWPPFMGCWALPGGYVEDGETTAEAANRELAEETGLIAPSLVQAGTYDTPGRDPRGRFVTDAYYCVVPDMWLPTAGDDATDAQWMPVADLLAKKSLAFDHGAILADVMHSIYTPR